MTKNNFVYVGHMIDMARKALKFVEGKNRKDFDADEQLRLSLTHLIQVIGEAARHLSDDFYQKYPQIPWPSIVGMRHKVVHDYMNIDEDLVWETVTHELPELIQQLEKIMPKK